MTGVPLFTLLASNALSITGNVMTQVAVPWFVLQTTGSPARTGVTGFFQFLPVVVAGFFGGTLVDRLGHRRTSVVADLASGATVAGIPLLYEQWVSSSGTCSRSCSSEPCWTHRG